MKILLDYFNEDIISWLEGNDLQYKEVNIKLDKGRLINIFNKKFCLKVYDCCGHGFGVNVNVSKKYDETIYDNDDFNLSWAYKYFDIKETASFYSRSENQYLLNLPSLILDLKNIIPRLNLTDSLEWKTMKEWMSKEATKSFT